MIRIGILGDIGSGKSYVAKNFGYPVFNADYEVSKLYQSNRKVYQKLKKALPEYIHEFPINKAQLSRAILANNSNLKRIIKVVHKEIRNNMRRFLNKNKNKKFDILDIPLLLVYVQSKKNDIIKNLIKRKNFNPKILRKFKQIQLPLAYKKKNSRFIIKNEFNKKSVKVGVENILKVIKNERSSS